LNWQQFAIIGFYKYFPEYGYYLNFLRESGYFVKVQTYSINAKFNKSAINRLPMYLPREDERREIVTMLDAVMKKIAVIQTKRRLLEELFHTLLHQLMTAQIRVNELKSDNHIKGFEKYQLGLDYFSKQISSNK
jgi:type I restriction enzyme, S subunit